MILLFGNHWGLTEELKSCLHNFSINQVYQLNGFETLCPEVSVFNFGIFCAVSFSCKAVSRWLGSITVYLLSTCTEKVWLNLDWTLRFLAQLVSGAPELPGKNIFHGQLLRKIIFIFCKSTPEICNMLTVMEELCFCW